MTEAAFWKDLEARCAAATHVQTLGTHQWAAPHFRRSGERTGESRFAKLPIRDIGFDARPAV
jgi:hypothetical protein